MLDTGEKKLIVYTFGYSGHKITDLESHIKRLGALVVDIRHSPRSRNATWRGSALQNRLGTNYVLLKEFGNINYRGGDIDIVDIVAGTNQVKVFLKDKPVILMCVCKDHAYCHRLFVAEHLGEKLGADIVHLGKPDERQMDLFPSMKQGKLM